MLQTYLTMMTIFVIGGVVSSLPVSTMKSPLNVFESRVNDHFTEFGNKVAAEVVSASSNSLNIDEVTAMVIAYLTDLGNRFLRAIMTIVTDIIVSMWYNPRPEEELIHEMTERFTEEFYKLFQSLYDLVVYLENYFGGVSSKQLTQQLQLAVQSLVSSLVHEVREVYHVVVDFLYDRSSIIDWMLNFFNLQPIAFVIYSLPMSILHTLMQVATQLLFASAAVLAQAQIIFDHMMHQILNDINNAVTYVYNAINALTLLPGIGK